jgi:hypothetical protein
LKFIGVIRVFSVARVLRISRVISIFRVLKVIRVLRVFNDLGPLDITPRRGVEGVPYGNHPCEKRIIYDIRNGYCTLKSSSMHIFSAHRISHDVHESSAPGTCVRRAYPGLKCGCELVSMHSAAQVSDLCRKTPITIQLKVGV